MGYSGQADDATLWNLTGGYLGSKLGIDSVWAPSYDIDGNSWFAGIEGEHSFGVISLSGGVTGGLIGRRGTRFVNDSLALTGGLTLGKGSAQGSYDGLFPRARIEGERGDQAGGRLALTPAARLRYAARRISSPLPNSHHDCASKHQLFWACRPEAARLLSAQIG